MSSRISLKGEATAPAPAEGNGKTDVPVAPDYGKSSALEPRFFGTDDMPEEMRRVAVEVAAVALTKKTNRDRAEHIKKHFDKAYSNPSSGGKWHCIVGTDFGSYVTHEAQNFVFFQLGAYFVLLFKA